MKNKILKFFKKYRILLIFILVFSWFILPNCFQNNENFNVILAEHVDSGSILSSILQLFDRSTPRSFYNQNIPYHTAYYGFPFNSLLFFLFAFVSLLLNIPLTNVEVFALIAKLVGFLAALLSIIVLFNLIDKLFKYKVTKVFYLLLFCIFSPFLHYSFHIKPDLLGLLFSLISITFLYDYLKKPKIIKNIIIANIFSGLAVLCKQPHVFIILPLLLGLVMNLKGNIKQNLKKFFYVYLVSGIILLFLMFFIHPYMFIENELFMSKQMAISEMVAGSAVDNINWWTQSYASDSLLLIISVCPFLFLLINLIKSLRNINTKFLSLLSLYAIVYLLWLTLKVGPMRTIAYLIPVTPISLLLYFYSLDNFMSLAIQKIIKHKVVYLFISCLLILLAIFTIVKNLGSAKETINSVYSFKTAETYNSTKKLEIENTNFENIIIIYSISLPINEKLYRKSTNTWQLPSEESIIAFEPNFLFIDFTVYWEKPYEYWKNIALKNGLNNERLFLDNVDKKNNIILFYK